MVLATEARWSSFKLEQTDENQIIAQILKRKLANDDNLIIDVGAGLGDIAWEAFPQKEAVLVDIADFLNTPSNKHTRIKVDFFDFQPCSSRPVTMLFSHVLQYLDDDIDRLRAKTEEFEPKRIIIVRNEIDCFQRRVFDWFDSMSIRFNAELPLSNFPAANYRLVDQEKFLGTIDAPNFATLADILANLIFDSSISTMECRKFGDWLSKNLPKPVVKLPQAVECYVRIEERI